TSGVPPPLTLARIDRSDRFDYFDARAAIGPTVRWRCDSRTGGRDGGPRRRATGRPGPAAPATPAREVCAGDAARARHRAGHFAARADEPEARPAQHSC